MPEAYAPGRSYPLVVRLSHPELGRAGFQLSARLADGPSAGAQAGEIAGAGTGDAAGGPEGALRVAVSRDPDGCVSYVHQTREGSEVTDTATEWRVVWTAPPHARAPVVFHLAGNAANDDASEFGDRVYALERTSAPDPER